MILSQNGPVTRPVYVIGTQEGYRLYGHFARYAVTNRLEGRLSVESLTNTRDDLNDGFGGLISAARGTDAQRRNHGYRPRRKIGTVGSVVLRSSGPKR